MKKRCIVEAKNIWIADYYRHVIGAEKEDGEESYYSFDGTPVEYEASFQCNPKSEEYKARVKAEEERLHIMKDCCGLKAFDIPETECDWCKDPDPEQRRFGFKDMDGNTVIPASYYDAGEFSCGWSPVSFGRFLQREGEKNVWVGRYGYIDQYGKSLFEHGEYGVDYFEYAGPFNKYGVAVVKDSSGYYLIDTSGCEIDDTHRRNWNEKYKYSDRFFIYKQGSAVELKGNNVGIYDTKTRQYVCGPKYAEAREVNEDTLCVRFWSPPKDAKKRMLIDGEETIKYLWLDGFTVVNEPDENGNAIVAIMSDWNEDEDEGVGWRYPIYGVISKDRVWRIGKAYSKIEYLGHGLYAAYRGKKAFLFDNNEFDYSVDKYELLSAYYGIDKQRRSFFFWGEEEQAEKAVAGMRYLLGDISYDRALLLYIVIAARVILGMDNERIAVTVKMDFSEEVPEDETEKVIAFARNICNNFAFLAKAAHEDQSDLHLQFNEANAESFEANRAKLLDAVLYEDFGTSIANPIYAYCADGSYAYLNQLYSDEMVPLTWEREGSVLVEDSSNPIDKYKIYLPSGSYYDTLYISMYSDRQSPYCPPAFYGKKLITVD